MSGTPLSLRFGSDGTISGIAGCNAFGGFYTADQLKGNTGNLLTGELISSAVGCPGSQDLGSALLASLYENDSFTLLGESLTLRNTTGSLVLGQTSPAGGFASTQWRTSGSRVEFDRSGNVTVATSCSRHEATVSPAGESGVQLGAFSKVADTCKRADKSRIKKLLKALTSTTQENRSPVVWVVGPFPGKLAFDYVGKATTKKPCFQPLPISNFTIESDGDRRQLVLTGFNGGPQQVRYPEVR